MRAPSDVFAELGLREDATSAYPDTEYTYVPSPALENLARGAHLVHVPTRAYNKELESYVYTNNPAGSRPVTAFRYLRGSACSAAYMAYYQALHGSARPNVATDVELGGSVYCYAQPDEAKNEGIV